MAPWLPFPRLPSIPSRPLQQVLEREEKWHLPLHLLRHSSLPVSHSRYRAISKGRRRREAGEGYVSVSPAMVMVGTREGWKVKRAGYRNSRLKYPRRPSTTQCLAGHKSWLTAPVRRSLHFPMCDAFHCWPSVESPLPPRSPLLL